MDERREGHPLWPLFMKWVNSGPPFYAATAEAYFSSPAKVWRIWLAGARAAAVAEAARGNDRPVNVVVGIEATAVGAKLDRLLEIVESPQEFSMTFRLAADPPQKCDKSG